MEFINLIDTVEKPITGEWGIDGGTIKVLRTTNFSNEGTLKLDSVVLRNIDSTKVSKKKLLKGDIIIEKSGGSPKQPVGRVVYFNEEGVFLCNNFTSILRPLNSVFPKYLHYILFVNHKMGVTNKYQNKTTGIINLKLQNYLKDIKIPLPPLETQKKIAEILDEADKLRQLNKQLIKKYDALTQSLFLDMFGDPVTNPKGWDEIKLGNVCGVGSSKRVFVDELVEDGIPFYRGTEVGKLGEGKSIEPTLFIKKEHYIRLKEHRGVPKQGDLLMPSICPDGRIWVVDNDKEFYFKDGRVLWVEVDSKRMNSIYLRYHLKGSFFANYNNIASGTTFAELKIVALKKMNVFYPEIKLQNQFANRIKEIEQQKAQAQQALQKSEELFNSLLQKAFKGELV